MKRLSKEQLATRDAHAAKLTELQEKVEAAVEAYNAALEKLGEPLQQAIEAYNEEVADFNAFREDIAGEQQGYIEDRSEAWVEGDKGQAYEAWKDAWETEIDQVEVELPGEIESPEMGAAELIGELPEEPDAI